MKKYFALAVVLIFALAIFSTSAIAQEKAPMTKGIKVGFNMAKFTGDDASYDDGNGTMVEPKFKTGFAFGGFLGFELGEAVTLQPELLYTMKGVKYEELGVTIKGKSTYLEVPVLIKYGFTTAGSTKPNLYFGPYMAFELSSDVEGEIGGMSAEVEVGNTKSTDFGLVIGGGLDFAAGSSTVVIDFRYSLGLTKLAGDEVEPLNWTGQWMDPGMDVKNSNLSIMLGMAF